MIIFSKPTLVSIIGLIIIVIGIPYGLYGLTLNGCSSLGGVLILFAVFITFIVLIFDRLLVSKIGQRNLSIVEFFILAIVIIFYSYSKRNLIIELENQKTNYFVLIENDGSFVNTELNYKFPFDKFLISKGNSAVINSISKNYHQLELDYPKDWNGLTMKPGKFKNINVQIYMNSGVDFTETQIDSLISNEVKTSKR